MIRGSLARSETIGLGTCSDLIVSIGRESKVKEQDPDYVCRFP